MLEAANSAPEVMWLRIRLPFFLSIRHDRSSPRREVCSALGPRLGSSGIHSRTFRRGLREKLHPPGRGSLNPYFSSRPKNPRNHGCSPINFTTKVKYRGAWH